MKMKSDEFKKMIRDGKFDEDSYLENFDPVKTQKMHTPDVAEKRKSIATYRGLDPKRKHKP